MCLFACTEGKKNGGGKSKEGAVYNVSMLLDTLLEGYDRRLRPGFGGMRGTEGTCAVHNILICINTIGGAVVFSDSY